MHHRIEKSGFHPGQYVGYCDGPWRIVKCVGGWRATRQDGRDYFAASTLEGIGRGLDQRANVAMGRALFR